MSATAFRRFARVALLCVAPTALAAEPTPLEPVVVTAAGYDQPQEQTAADLQIIDRAQIEAAMASDVAQIIQRLAGIDIGRTGGPGRQTSLFIRGGNSNHTLVLVDGVPINSGSTGAAALQHLDPDLVERIEVLRGPRASLYGSSALAGVIHVITRRPAGRGLGFEAGLGADGGRNLATHGQWQDGSGLQFAVAASAQRVERFRPRTHNPRETDYAQRGVSLNLSRPLGDARVFANLWQSTAQVGYLDFSGTTELDQDTENRSARLGASGDVGPWSWQADLLQMSDQVQQQQSADFAKTYATTLATRLGRRLGDRQQLWLDLSWTDEDLRALSGSDFGAGPVAEQREYGSAGLLFDHRGDRLLLQAVVSHEDRAVFDAPLLWNLDAGWRLGPRLTLLGLAGRGFRAPTVLDRFGFGGNPDLRPETSRSLELGLRWQPLAGLRTELRAFENRVDDLLSFDLGTFTLQNIERARTRGLELSSVWQHQGWRVDAGFSAQQPENLSTGQPLLRRSQRSGSLAVAWNGSRHGWHAEVVAVGERPDFGGARLGGYALLNVGGRLTLGDGFSLLARVDNLLDADYQTAAGFREPNLSGSLAIRWESAR